jgi:multidrug efflux system membrane fusion protein
VAYDEVQLEYCHIVSPIAGRVGLRLVDPGNTVFAGSGSTLVVITQLQPITVVFNVSEDELPQVQAQLSGDSELSVGAFDRANAHLIESGMLTSLDNQVDTTTGTVRFRAEFPNKALALFPNQFVNARLLVQMLKDVTLVPTAAIQHNGANDFVYVVKPNSTVAVQNVTALTTNEQDTAVQGLNRGVRIAMSGFDRLENGARVMVRTPGPQQARVPATDTVAKSTNDGIAPQ